MCEVSSFQLEDVARARLRRRGAAQPRAGSPRPARHVRGVPRGEAADLRARAASRSCPRGSGLDGIEFSADDPLPAEPLLRGAHNRENAAAATAAARAAGIGDDAIAEALRTFPGVPHRLEPVGEVDGVRYVNDSKATNVAAALRGARGVRGRARAPDPRRLARRARASRRSPRRSAPNVLSIHLIGEAARARARRLLRPAARTTTGTLERAVEHAARPEARPRATVGAAQPGLRELRPVRETSSTRRRWPSAALRSAIRGSSRVGAQDSIRPGESVRVKRGELESRILILVTLALVAFGIVMVYSATSASAAVGGGEPELLPRAAGHLRRRSGSS